VTALSPRHLRWLARCLLAAMVLAVLAPSVSRTLAAQRSAGDWVQICTAQGMEWIQLGATDSPEGADDPLAAHDLCGHCTLAAERFAPLLPTLPVLPQADGSWGTPLHRAAVLHDLQAPSPGARGPPVMS